MHYYQFNIGDYKSHTSHLTPIEDLIYRRLLDAYYLSERPLNSGVTSVARQINMRDNEEEVGTILSEFFVLTEDGWVNKRADSEIEKYKAKIEQTSRAGRESAKRRASVKPAVNGRSTDVQLNKNQEPITNNQKKEPSPDGAKLIFEYARELFSKAGKKDPGAFIGKLRKQHGDEKVMAALEATKAMDIPPSDPAAYLMGVLNPKPGDNPHHARFDLRARRQWFIDHGFHDEASRCVAI